MKMPLINHTLAMRMMRQTKPNIKGDLKDVKPEDRKTIHKITSRVRS